MMMKSLFPLIVLIVSPSFESPADQATKDPKAVAIFDGKTFEGWEGDLKIFRIEAGAIVGGSLKDKIARNEFLHEKSLQRLRASAEGEALRRRCCQRGNTVPDQAHSQRPRGLG